jgi:hypothetical protein
MAVSRFIILRNSAEQALFLADPLTPRGKKFRVLQGGYQPVERKMQSAVETIGGRLDVTVGPIFYVWTGVIRTAHTLSAAALADGYGTLSDLRDYFMLNNPAGTPSNIITLVDHTGSAHSGILSGPSDTFSPQALTTQIEGEQAHFFIPIQLSQLQAVA